MQLHWLTVHWLRLTKHLPSAGLSISCASHRGVLDSITSVVQTSINFSWTEIYFSSESLSRYLQNTKNTSTTTNINDENWNIPLSQLDTHTHNRKRRDCYKPRGSGIAYFRFYPYTSVHYGMHCTGCASRKLVPVNNWHRTLPYSISRIIANPKASMQIDWYHLAVHRNTREHTFVYTAAEKQAT